MNKDDVAKLLKEGYKVVGVIIADEEACLAVFIDSEPMPVDGMICLDKKDWESIHKQI
ncbi:MAG: hypothetical protein QQN63_05370 [Nitrosopumilus sp.]